MLERARVTRPSNECLRAEASTRVWLHVGDIVYLTYDSGKHEIIRPRYVVASIEGQWCQVKKFTGTQLRNRSYRVKKSECITVRRERPRHTSHNALGKESEF